MTTNSISQSNDFQKYGVQRRTHDIVVRETVNLKESASRPVRIEELVTKYYEKPMVEEHVRYVQKVVEVERKVPEYQIVEREVEILDDKPTVIKKYVDVPKVVEETVVVPSKQKKIVELNPVIEKIVPKTHHRIIEKEIKKPKIIEVPRVVPVEVKQLIPRPQFQADVPLVVSSVMLPPVVRQSGTVTVPVTRLVPKIQYVDIVIPNRSCSNKELTELLQSQIHCRLIKQTFRPIANVTEVLNRGECLKISNHRREDDVNIELKSGPSDGTINANGLYIDFQHTESQGNFTAADYNSWLLALNEHLNDPASLGFTDESQEEWKSQLINTLPFIRSNDGAVLFLQPGTAMNGEIIPRS